MILRGLGQNTAETVHINISFALESIEWFIGEQPFLRSCDSAPRPPPSSPDSLSRYSCVSLVELTERRGGWARSQIIRPRESLALYNSHNTLWFQDFFGSLAAMAAAEVPAYIASMFLMEAFGRRSVLSFCQVS